MITLVETVAAAILMILIVLLIVHMVNGTALQWLSSKFKAA